MNKKTLNLKLILPIIIAVFILVLLAIAIALLLSLFNFINQEKRAILNIKEEIPEIIANIAREEIPEIVANIAREEISRGVIQETGNITPQVRTVPRIVSPAILAQLKQTGIARYFLSEINLIASRYSSRVHRCLYNGNNPRFPQYIYETWAMLTYPKESPLQIALVRYLLLPEDNNIFTIDSDCYIKEISTREDWQYVNNKYGFQKENF